MVKVLIAGNLHDLLREGSSFLNRADVRVLTAISNDEMFQIHRTERVDLIITQIDMPGMSSEKLFSAIRADRALQSVATIMVCTNNPGEIEKCARCGVSDVVLRPVNPRLLLARAQQFLALYTRESSRVPLSVDIEAVHRGKTFSCCSLDIGASGMMIETDKILAQGDSITCSFSFPGAPPIRADAEIVNVPRPPRESRRKRYGMRFTKLPDEARKAIQAFVDLQSRAAA